jgi:hypothetical protein
MFQCLHTNFVLLCLCRASERSRHSDSKVDEVLIFDKRTQYFIMFRRISRKRNAVWKTEIFNDRPGKQYGNKLRTYRLFKNNFAFESYLDVDNFKCLHTNFFCFVYVGLLKGVDTQIVKLMKY